MNKSIPEYSEFNKDSTELERLLESGDTNCLREYLDYLDKYCARDDFFLLRNGDIHPLPSEPGFIYLLPDILGWETKRLVLCQYRNPPSVSLLTWEFSAEGKATIGVFCAGKGSPMKESPVEGIAEHGGELEKRALRIQAKFDDSVDTIQIVLEFPHGRVIIRADEESGIQHVDWKSRDNATPHLRHERSSWGDMPEIVGVKWYDEPSSWRDDALYFDKQEVKWGSPTPLGHVLSADASGRQPECIYLATNQARVARIIKGVQGKIVYSTRLGGLVHDVLVTPDPDHPDRDAILATTYDGTVYLLKDQDNKLNVLHIQAPGSPLTRMIGGGGMNLLALDKQYNLLPLRLIGTRRVEALRESATRVFLHRVESRAQADKDEFHENSRLALEIGLRTLGTADFPLEALQHLAGWLKQSYQELDEDAIRNKARLHFKLMQRVYAWLRATARNGLSHFPPELRTLLSLLELPEDAPDRLWLYAMRHQDHLTYWEENNLPGEKAKNSELGMLLEKCRNSAGAMRKAMLPAIHKVRPLSVTGGARLGGQVRHLRKLSGEDADGTRHVILWEHPVRMRILRIPADPTQTWEKICDLDEKRGDWQGLPTVIASGIELDQAFSSSGRLMPHILIGTNRGELCLFRWEKRELVAVRKWTVAIVIACLRLVTLDKKNRYLLLGGSDAWRRPAIWRMPLDTPNRPPQALWSGEVRGQIHMMQIHENRDLWAIERRRRHGRLWHWSDIGDKLKRDHAQFLDPEQPWLDQDDSLHVLDLASVADGKKRLLCGGDKGMAYVLDAENGRLAWLAGCGYSLRQAAFLGEGDDDNWLVGGDSLDTLLLDSRSHLSGVVEKLGPVTAICKLDQHRLLVGGLDGKLTLLSDTLPSRDMPPPPAPKQGGLGEYPLRHKDGTTCPRTLAATIGKLEPGDDETITSQALLEMVQHCLLEASPDDELAAALAKYAQHQPPARVAWLLRTLPSEVPLAGAWLALIAALWEGIEERPPDEPLEHIINALLALLERHAVEQGERALLEELLTCLWEGSGCPSSLGKKPERIKLMRLAQAQRQWQQASDPVAAVLVANWCANLQKIWHCVGDQAPTVYAKRLHIILKENLPWLGSDEDGWLTWLDSLACTAPDAVAQSAPLPLTHLENPALHPMERDVFQALLDLWPDDPAWRRWLTDLQTHLDTVMRVEKAFPHFAWHERDALRGLNAHVYDAPFRLESHPLQALWRPRLVNAWGAAVQKRIDAIEVAVLSNTADYIDVDVVDRWLGDGRVELRLELVNRTHSALRLEQASWQGNAVTPDGVQPDLPTNKLRTILTLPIQAELSDHVTGEIRLSFRDGLGRLLERILHPNCRRGIAGFTSDPGMAATWRRLDGLIQSWVEHKKTFLWLDGHVLSREEHESLRTHVRIKFKLAPEVMIGLAQDASITNDKPIFSPDLALGASDARLLEQVHALLHDRCRPGLSWVALSLWRWARPEEWPPALESACRDKLRSYPESEQLFQRLLGETDIVARVKQALCELPTIAVGAWCYGDPLYAGRSTEMRLTSYYAPAAALLGYDFWHRADKVPVEEMAYFLGSDATTVTRNHECRQKAYPLLQAVNESPENAMDIAGRRFLEQISGKVPVSLNGAWRADTCVTLHYRDFEHLYLLSPLMTDPELDALARVPAGLWLTLGERRNYPLPGKTLHLNADDALRLAQTETAQIPIALNQIAAIQTRVHADTVFRTAGGLPGEMIAKHFAERENEIAEIRRCLAFADGNSGGDGSKYRGSGGAALIIGGRRMGKTTLRQRLIYEESERNPERLKVSLNFEGTPEYSGIALFRWFWHAFRHETMSPDRSARHIPQLEWSWSEAQEKSPLWMGRQQVAVCVWLDEVKKRTGHALLLTLDETDHLVRKDAVEHQKDSFRIFRFLRDLLAAGRLCLAATVYPHGTSKRDSLVILDKHAYTPLFNTFSTRIQLSAWRPETTWDFLHDKLAGLGVILPESYRMSLLEATRGVPWMVHALGLALCSGTSGRRRLVLPDDWGTALSVLSRDVRNELVTTVRGVAESNDARHGMTAVGLPQASLGGNRLLNALFQLAKERMPAVSRQDWGVAKFTLNELAEKIGVAVSETRLRETLDRLTSTMVLEGDVAEEGMYYFGAGMLAGVRGQGGY